MCNNDVYKFVGVINRFGVYPDFVYPVFEKNDKYYLEFCYDNFIHSFKEITEKKYIDKIRLFDECMLSNIKIVHFVGDEKVMAFQIDKDNFIVNGINDFSLFIKNFVTDDIILSEAIDYFFFNMNKENYKIKIKEKTK